MSEASVVFKTFEIKVADGREWKLRRPTLGVEAIYARHLEKVALDTINRQRMTLGPLGYKEAIAQHIENSGIANHFGWLRPGFVSSISDHQNVAHLLWAWIGANHKDSADPLYVAGQKEMYLLYAANVDVFTRTLNEVLDDPNPLQPE